MFGLELGFAENIYMCNLKKQAKANYQINIFSHIVSLIIG